MSDEGKADWDLEAHILPHREPDGFEFVIRDGELGWNWWGEPKLTVEQAAVVVQAQGYHKLKLAVEELATAVSTIAQWMPEAVAAREGGT